MSTDMKINVANVEHKEVGFGEELLKNNFAGANFTNNERTWIEVLTNENGHSLSTHQIEYDLDHPNCQALMKFTTLYDIHESTYIKVNKERKEFEEFAISIAKRDGLVQTDDTSPSRILDYIFSDKEADEDEMFALKIALFEVDKIKDSKNLDGKKALRKSKTRIELLKGAIDLYSEAE